MAGIAQIEPPRPCIGNAVAPGPRRQDAIEHVDSPPHRLKKIVRRANAHEVAGLGGWQPWAHAIDHGEHDGLRLADGQPAQRVTVKAHVDECLGAFHPQGFDGAALDNAEERVARLAGKGGLGTLRPSQRQQHGAARFCFGAGEFDSGVNRCSAPSMWD